MGSVVEYRCAACAFTSGQLSVGWGKAGRQSFWGALARCNPCMTLGVVDLIERNSDRSERRCGNCNAPLTILEGLSIAVPCPRCNTPMHHAPLGTWM